MTLVSAILPTRGRSEWAKRAVDIFLSQTYPHKELIVLDDQNDRSFPDGAQSLPAGQPILYFQHASRSIPEKRNIACGFARGEIIWHLDSDDYSAPERMAEQVALLQESGKSLVGYHSMLFYDERTRQAYAYRHPFMGLYAIGTSMCYRRDWWQQYRFDQGLREGEDTRASDLARSQGQLVSLEGRGLMVARLHTGNTSAKQVDGSRVGYCRVAHELIPPGFFA